MCMEGMCGRRRRRLRSQSCHWSAQISGAIDAIKSPETEKADDSSNDPVSLSLVVFSLSLSLSLFLSLSLSLFYSWLVLLLLLFSSYLISRMKTTTSTLEPIFFSFLS